MHCISSIMMIQINCFKTCWIWRNLKKLWIDISSILEGERVHADLTLIWSAGPPISNCSSWLKPWLSTFHSCGDCNPLECTLYTAPLSVIHHNHSVPIHLKGTQIKKSLGGQDGQLIRTWTTRWQVCILPSGSSFASRKTVPPLFAWDTNSWLHRIFLHQ